MNWLQTTIQFIEEDRKYRKENKWLLVTIDTVKEYGNRYKVDDSMFSQKSKYTSTISNIKPFTKIINDLFNISDVKDCMVIAGGYLYEHILSSNDDRNYRNRRDIIDIDCFFYGKSVKEINSIFKKISKFFNSDHSIIESRNQYVYNFQYTDSEGYDYIFQFILKIFENKSSIIGQFDVTSSSVLYDGKNVLFTPISAFSYATLYNYVDTMRASPTYEQRLFKYFLRKRGFGIAFPEFDMTKVDKLDLKQFPVYTCEISNNKMKKIPNNQYSKIEYLIKKINSYRDKDENVNDEYSIYGQFVNTPKLVDLYFKQKMNKVYFVVKNGYCTINTNDIKNFYNDKTALSYHSNIYNLRYYYDDNTFIDLINQIKYFSNGKHLEIRDRFVTKLISDILMYIDENYNSKENKFEWLTDKSTVNPLNPCPIDAKTWYGEYYNENIKISS